MSVSGLKDTVVNRNLLTAMEAAKTAAETAETNAETAETNAETAQTAAAASATAAETSATSAATSATSAAASEASAEDDRIAAQNARNAAESIRQALENSTDVLGGGAALLSLLASSAEVDNEWQGLNPSLTSVTANGDGTYTLAAGGTIDISVPGPISDVDLAFGLAVLSGDPRDLQMTLTTGGVDFVAYAYDPGEAEAPARAALLYERSDIIASNAYDLELENTGASDVIISIPVLQYAERIAVPLGIATLAPRSADYVAKSSAYTVTDADNGKTIFCTSALTLTFPSTLPNDLQVHVVHDAASGNVTLAASGGDSLAGSSSITTRYERRTVIKRPGRSVVCS